MPGFRPVLALLIVIAQAILILAGIAALVAASWFLTMIGHDLFGTIGGAIALTLWISSLIATIGPDVYRRMA